MAIAFRAAATASATSSPPSITISKPTGTVDGDVMFAVFAADELLSVSLTGWTSVTSVDATDSGQRLVVLRKVAASEGANYEFTTSGSFSIAAAILSYSGVDNTTPVDVSGTNRSGNDTEAAPQSPVAPTITTTVADTMLLYIATVDLVDVTAGSSWAPPSGYTERVDTIDTSFICPLTVAEKAQAATGATGTASGTCTTSPSRNGESMAIHLAIKPAGGSSSTTVTPGVGAATLNGRNPTTSAFSNVRIREVLVNASGQPVGSVSNISLLVWYAGRAVGAPDVSLNSMTTDADGTTSWSIASGTLAFNQAVFYVAMSSDTSVSAQTCARVVPSYE
jgi:hypothetical protein